MQGDEESPHAIDLLQKLIIKILFIQLISDGAPVALQILPVGLISVRLEFAHAWIKERIDMTSIRIFAALFAAAGIAQAGDLYVQDFESGSGYSTSVPEFSEGFDYFTRTDGSNIPSSASYSGAQGSFFAGQDLDGEGDMLPLALNTGTFSILGATDIMFSVDLAEDDDGSSQDWDNPDFVRFEYKLDDGGWETIFTVENDGSTFNTAPLLNGVEITDTFSTFSADLSALSGSTLAIRVLWNLNSGDEDLAIDNIRVSGNVAVVPLPPAAWAGLGMLGLMAGARMRRK